jgi:uncharacterized membrane protein
MNQNKKLLIGIIILIAFFYVVFTINSLLVGTASEVCEISDGGHCNHQEQLGFLIWALPLIISIAVIAGAGIYYFMAGKMEKKVEVVKNNTEILLKFLNPDERKLVNLLIENDGKVIQAELTRLPGMSKVKSHRVVQKLIDRGVIEKETLGKTNIVRFSEEIKQGLL